jgi:predicted DNA binding protein
MAVITELTIHSDEFDLGRVTTLASGIHIELERVVPVGSGIMPYFWASGGNFTEFEKKVRDEKVVKELNVISRLEDKVLYEVRWADETVRSLTDILVESNATILDAFGNDKWEFTIRFPDHEDLSTFHERTRSEGIPLSVTRIVGLRDTEENGDMNGITPEQRDALTLAVERGFFKVPRQVSLEQVAKELDISQQATSERIRRGADTMLSNLLLAGK